MWLPNEGKFILLFSNKISESGISAWATTRGRPYEIIFMLPNNNLPVCFLLDHPGKLIPESYPGSGVAMRPNNNLAIYKRTRNARPYRNVYIEPGIIIYNLPDTDKSLLRTIAIRYRSVKLRPKLRIKNYAFKISLPQSACAVVLHSLQNKAASCVHSCRRRFRFRFCCFISFLP